MIIFTWYKVEFNSFNNKEVAFANILGVNSLGSSSTPFSFFYFSVKFSISTYNILSFALSIIYSISIMFK